MKYLLTLVLATTTFAGTCQTDEPATIYMFLGKKWHKKLQYTIDLNRQQIAKIKRGETVKFEMYSSGNVLMEIFNLTNRAYTLCSVPFKVEPGETYYLHIKGYKDKTEFLDPEAAEAFFAENDYLTYTFEIKEDIEHPIAEFE